MNERRVIGLCALFSLITAVALLALMADGNVAIAQRPETTPTAPFGSLPPDSLVPRVGGIQPAQIEQPDSGAVTTEYLHIPGQAFTPLWSNVDIYYASSGCVYVTGTYKYLGHPVILPYHSTITQLRFYWKDASATDDGLFNLIQYDDGLSSTYLYTLTTSGSSGTATYTTLDINETIDYMNYSYFVLWRPVTAGNAMQLCGYRLTYDRPLLGASFLPLIRKSPAP